MNVLYGEKHLELGALQMDSTEGRDRTRGERETRALSLGGASTRLELPVPHPSGGSIGQKLLCRGLFKTLFGVV